MIVPELPSENRAALPANDVTAPVLDPPSARATWSLKAPDGPWCPREWVEHLSAVAPALMAPRSLSGPPVARSDLGDASEAEATGTCVDSHGWRLLLVSRRGRLHAHRGEHREDAGALLTFNGGWCAAVADGAGSAKWSRLGSAIATQAVLHALRDTLQHGAAHTDAIAAAMTKAAAATNDSMRAFATKTGVALRDLRTTLLVVLAHRDCLATMQVGDGAIALITPTHDARLPHQGDSGEFSGEVTHFLPDDGAVERLIASVHIGALRDTRAVVAASDGVEDPWYPFARHAPALLSQWRDGVTAGNAATAGVTQPMRGAVLTAPDPVRAALEWLTFEKRGENDDRTIFVAWDSSASD